MKYSAAAATRHAHASIIREDLAKAGMHHACRIRKCRRDGHCTGPLYSADHATSEIGLIGADESKAYIDQGVLPVCVLTLSDEAVAAMIGRLTLWHTQMQSRPEMTVLSPDRAIEARSWLKFGELSPLSTVPARHSADEPSPAGEGV